ncbi:MAG: hypothetical protein H6738_03755 [Alphaproteobacteria bacterium]|nr:hypothetical protein [Alphaproteobacteria bacterium]MCB9695884.1 hypothetical protein [Alphaproteobacteria bacterium]
MRTFALLAALAVAPALTTPAVAAPSAEDMRQAQSVLMESANAENQMMGAIIAALDAMDPLNVSAEAKASYDEAKTLRGEAEELWKKKEHREAYMKFREAADKLEPALAEALGWSDIPKPVLDSGAKLVAVDARRVQLVAELVGDQTSAEAKAAYEESKTMYADARRLWDAGQRRDASVKAWASLKKADVAIRETWKDNAPKATP